MSVLNEKIATVEYDNLIADINPPTEVYAVKIKAGQGILKRGSVLSLESDGTFSLMNTGGHCKLHPRRRCRRDRRSRCNRVQNGAFCFK